MRNLITWLRLTRPGLALYVLRGRSLAYRIRLEDGGIVLTEAGRAIVVECAVIRTPAAAGIIIVP